MAEMRKYVAKWGFGMSPISKRMRERYDNAVQHVCDVIDGSVLIDEVVPDYISEVKGMMNRCIREDQWDWFTVYTEFGTPSRKDLRQTVSHLIPLRKAVVANDQQKYDECLRSLIVCNALQPLYNYQGNLKSQTYSEGAGWIYILSTREQPNVLKIGRTDRTVAERVREINSATGVVVPWAARRTFRVRDAKKAETEIHCRLSECRIRKDREFFHASIGQAVDAIIEYLEQADQKDRYSGRVIWFDSKKGYGFVALDGYEDVFLHRSQLSREDINNIDQGTLVEFVLGRHPKGPYAMDVVLGVKDNSGE